MKIMKKVLVSLMLIGIYIFSFNLSASAEEVKDSKVDPVVEGDGKDDGINDSSSVQTKITKISDRPLDEIFFTQGAGEWDEIGYDSFKSQSKVFYSGGGNLKIYIYQPDIGPGFEWWYKLYEDDTFNDDLVSRFELPNDSGTFEVEFNVRSYTDGNNNKAELYLQKNTNPLTSVQTTWYD